MSEENNKQEVEQQFEIEEAYPVIQQTMDKFLAAADVAAVYGELIEHDDIVILPTAEVLSVAGFGVGSGFASEESDEKQISGGGGGGGGGIVLSRPVAIVVSSPGGVYIEPVVDVTKIALAALTAAGFMVGMVSRMLRGR